tara:strand:- start:78 stop:1061 length:984 start_codon:yes stop_codon:yes gene_type:complete
MNKYTWIILLVVAYLIWIVIYREFIEKKKEVKKPRNPQSNKLKPYFEETNKIIDEKILSLRSLANEWNCEVENVEETILSITEMSMTTEQQAIDIIKKTESSIYLEARTKSISPNNTACYIIVDIIKKYINKIKTEYISDRSYPYLDDNNQALKCNVFNYHYCLNYLALQHECNVDQVVNLIETESYLLSLDELVNQMLSLYDMAEVESKDLPIDEIDSPNGIKAYILETVYFSRINQIIAFGKKLNKIIQEKKHIKDYEIGHFDKFDYQIELEEKLKEINALIKISKVHKTVENSLKTIFKEYSNLEVIYPKLNFHFINNKNKENL